MFGCVFQWCESPNSLKGYYVLFVHFYFLKQVFQHLSGVFQLTFFKFENEAYFHGSCVALTPGHPSPLKFILKRKNFASLSSKDKPLSSEIFCAQTLLSIVFKWQYQLQVLLPSVSHLFCTFPSLPVQLNVGQHWDCGGDWFYLKEQKLLGKAQTYWNLLPQFLTLLCMVTSGREALLKSVTVFGE